jgi:hypothetical protein
MLCASGFAADHQHIGKKPTGTLAQIASRVSSVQNGGWYFASLN